MPFTETQQYALAFVPKVTGLISLIFSALVIYTVAICKEKRSKTYHRLLFGISCVDVSSSFWLGLSTWPIPEETGIKWASGNTQTCTLQGFFTQFGITSSFYNASLSIFYLLVIRFGWKEKSILKIEPILHGFPLLWGFGTAIAGLPLTIFNSANLWCWVSPYQDRGADADLYRWVFFYGPLWVMIFVVTINLILIFQHVRKIERATEKYRFAHRVHSSHFQAHSNSAASSEEHGAISEDLEDLYGEDDFSEVAVPIAGDSLDDILEEKGEDEGEGDVGVEEYAEQNTTLPTEEQVDTTTGMGSGLVQERHGVEKQSPQHRRDSNQDALDESSGRNFRSFLSLRSSGRKSVSVDRSAERRRRKARRSREVANQSLRYAGSFYFTWIALTVSNFWVC